MLDWIGGPDAYRKSLSEVPPLRASRAEEMGAQAALIEHILERVRLVLPEGTKYSGTALACWVAVRMFALKPKALAACLGYASGRVVSAIVARLTRSLRRDSRTLSALARC